MRTSSDHDIEAMIRRIEHRVLEDVWMSRRARVLAITVVVTLGAAAMSGWADVGARAATATPGIAVCSVALALFALTAAASSIALALHRFRWCFAAAYAGGLATLAGLGVIWWHQTTPDGPCPGPCAWMLAGTLCSVVLTMTWLRVTLTPLERSQPDIRVSPAPVR